MFGVGWQLLAAIEEDVRRNSMKSDNSIQGGEGLTVGKDRTFIQETAVCVQYETRGRQCALITHKCREVTSCI